MSLVSIVIPIYNEEENVNSLYSELNRVTSTWEYPAEFVFVDDGSSDRSVELLLKAAGDDSRVKIVRFRRNFGQTAAMSAGFEYATGDIIATIDGDLQNDPAEIPKMVSKLNEGYDVVAGWRKDRQDAFINRKLPSMLANKLISKTTKVKLHDYGCTLKVMRSEVAKNINLYGEMHRFIPALAADMGVSIAEVPVNHRARQAGSSKYGISRTFRVILDLLTVKFFLGYATRPLHMFGILGFISGGVGALICTVLGYEKLILGMSIGNRPLLLLGAMLVLVGLQFFCFGLLAEVLTRTYHESQNKKTYTVREIITAGKNKLDGDISSPRPKVVAL